MSINLDSLLKLRLAVARYGEMDIARWWNTQGLLGRNGSILFSRGFPRTHYLAQARVVISVAENRCKDIFDTSSFITLWRLTPEIEDQFENQWGSWLDRIEELFSFFSRLERLQSGALRDFLIDQDLASSEVIALVLRHHKPVDGRAVALPAATTLNDGVVTMLAAGFLNGEIGSPVIPYVKL